MPREFDARESGAVAVSDTRLVELKEVAAATSDGLPGAHRIVIGATDEATGNPSLVVSHDASAATPDTYIAEASAHLRAIFPVLGLREGAETAFRVDPTVARTTAGAAAVHAQQEYKGILVFQASEVVRFAPTGVLEDTAGKSVTVTGDPSPDPTLSSVDAAVAAVQFVATPAADELDQTDEFGEPLHTVAVDTSGFAPTVVSEDASAERRTTLEGAPLEEPVHASLVWLPLDAGLRLTWQVVLTLPTTEQWRVLVDAADGNVLYAHLLTTGAKARGNVYMPDGGSPRQMLDFPRPLSSYAVPVPAGLPTGFPRDWVDVDRTVGNAANGHLGVSGASAQGSVVGGIMTFNPADATGDDQKVLNICFLCNYMHDYLYLLGFREADGNFQQNDFGLGGLAADRVDARAFSGAVNGTANMSTPPDGSPPIMNMGLVTSTGRHTAFDASVVFHEYTHGLTNRLVGGPANANALDAFQSGSMGEGWSDYVACTINNTVVVGNWIVNNTTGIRGFPYDTNYPDHYGKLGTGRYNEVHNNGEIWCVALLEMNRRIGANLAVQAVVDALKLTPANPTYLQARDAIITALEHKATTEGWSAADRMARIGGAWRAFAKFGMGVHAQSGPSTTVSSGIVADFTIPPEFEEDAAPSVQGGDIALVRQVTGWGSIPVAFAKGDGTWNITNGAAPTFIGNWANTPGARIVSGDFNGNGLTDIALVNQNPGWGSIPIAFAKGDGTWNITNGAAPTFIGNWANTPGVQLVSGDFNG
jgi:extracellular elastinolytic metalloproteinase